MKELRCVYCDKVVIKLEKGSGILPDTKCICRDCFGEDDDRTDEQIRRDDKSIDFLKSMLGIKP